MKKRPSQGAHRSRPRKKAAVGGRRRLKEDPRRLKCQKDGEAGFGEDWWRLRSARRRRTSLLVEARHQKVGHAPSRAGAWKARRWVFGSGALRKAADLLFALLMMWLMSENVAGGKNSPEKSPVKCWRWWGFSDHDMADRKALGDRKGNWNETRSLDGFP